MNATKLLCIMAAAALLLSVLSGCIVEDPVVGSGEEIYTQVTSAMADFPQLPEGFAFLEVYYQDEAGEYALLIHKTKQITAKRANGQEIYYMDGMSWQTGQSGALEALESAGDPIVPVMEKAMKALLAEADLTYACYEAKAAELPLWVYPGETYVLIDRPGYEDCSEVMLYQTADGETELRWNIANTGTEAVLFVTALSQPIPVDAENFCSCLGATWMEPSLKRLSKKTNSREMGQKRRFSALAQRPAASNAHRRCI